MPFLEKLKYVYRGYRYRYHIDKMEVRYLIQNLAKGQIAADIGAHKGGYLYWLEKRVGTSGTVYCFEPQKKLYEYLKRIQKIQGYHNVVIENKGVSSSSGALDLYVPKTKNGTSPGAKISTEPLESSEYEIQRIELVTLDDYFLEKGVFPNAIKIDTEGHEREVLLGGDLVLNDCQTVLMECESRHQDGGNIFEVFEILLTKGFSGYFFEQDKMTPLSEFRPERHQRSGEGSFWEAQGYVNNFIFNRT